MDSRPIGVFDSGMGGLTSIAPLMEKLPNEQIIYYGDTARAPYGSKSPETICDFTCQIVDYLVSKGVKMLVIACNTISATAMPRLAESFPNIPVVGIIKPAAEYIATTCVPSDSIGVIGTKVTVNSNAYPEAVSVCASGLSMHSLACPPFVPLIEEGIIENEIMDLTIRHYLEPFISSYNINKLVLGCTHYDFIKGNINRLYPELGIINPSEIVAQATFEVLTAAGLLAQKRGGENIYCASDLSENFINFVAHITGASNFKTALQKF